VKAIVLVGQSSTVCAPADLRSAMSGPRQRVKALLRRGRRPDGCNGVDPVVSAHRACVSGRRARAPHGWTCVRVGTTGAYRIGRERGVDRRSRSRTSAELAQPDHQQSDLGATAAGATIHSPEGCRVRVATSIVAYPRWCSPRALRVESHTPPGLARNQISRHEGAPPWQASTPTSPGKARWKRTWRA
jgi:hypothetical protein